MARRTHKMIAANPNVVDNGAMTQANSISAPCVAHYLSCEETGGTINTLTDVKKDQVMLDKMIGVFVEHAVVTLVSDGQHQALFPGLAHHLLAVGDGPGHQFLRQHVQPRIQAGHRDRRVLA